MGVAVAGGRLGTLVGPAVVVVAVGAFVALSAGEQPQFIVKTATAAHSCASMNPSSPAISRF